MRAPLIYRRLASPLHATRAPIACAWVGAIVLAALLLESPLVLGTLTLALLGAGVGAGVGAQLRRGARGALIMAVPIVVVNVLVSRKGLTVFARLGDLGPFGQGDLTVEALVYGAVIALKVSVLTLATTLASVAIDPDELLAALRRRSFASALTASLTTRMVGVLYADAQRLADAQRTRPGAHTGARARARLLSAIVSSSLERSIDVAATLELRGFAAPRSARRAGRRAPLSRHDLAFAISAAGVAALALWARVGGLAPFVAYPLLRMPLTAATPILCGALAAALLAPMFDRRGIER